MNHLNIFGLIISLVIGALVYSYAFQIYKDKKNQIPKSFLSYILFCNLLVLAYFSTRYFATNISQRSSDFNMEIKIIFLLRMALWIISEFGIAYTIYKTISYLKKKAPSKNIKGGFFLLLISFTGFYIIIIVDFFNTHHSQILGFIDGVWQLLLNLIIIIMAMDLIIYSRKHLKNDKSTRAFSIFILVAYLAYLVPLVTYYAFNIAIGVYCNPIILILINLSSFFWLKFFVVKFPKPLPLELNQEKQLDSICVDYDISKREKDIVNCLIEGRSNKEMTDILFISFHTVKNHVYTVFKKFDVKSRSQLIHKINQELKK